MRLSDYVVRFVAAAGRKACLPADRRRRHAPERFAGPLRRSELSLQPARAGRAIAAENYAKATGNLGVAMVTTGPGGTNAITGVAGAWLDSTPMLFVSGQVKRPDRMYAADGTPLGVRQLGMQEVDIVSHRPSHHQVRGHHYRPADHPLSPGEGRASGPHGRPGPVWIDIPIDVQAVPLTSMLCAASTPAHCCQQRMTTASRNRFGDVIARLNQAERPLLLVGNGVRLAHAARGI